MLYQLSYAGVLYDKIAHSDKMRILASAFQKRKSTADCRLPIADCRLPIADCRLPIAEPETEMTRPQLKSAI
jgi:hypothetical protein